MKRIGHIYEKIADKDNIKSAIMKASNNKRSRGDVKRVLENIDKYTDKIHQLLTKESYIPSPYETETRIDGIKKKERLIHKPRFYPDQIIHWALILQLEPIFMKSTYQFNCGNIPGRGMHYGKKTIEKWIRTDRKNTKYFLQLDIKKFYPSIDIEKLIQKMKNKIKCSRTISLISQILRLEENMPIGILLSQWFSNVYLEKMDYYIKQKLRAVHYLRYVDDMVIFGPNKKKLHKMRKDIEDHLNQEGLQLKSNYQVKRLDKEFLDMLGFRFYRNKTTLRRSIMLRITRKARKISKNQRTSYKMAAGMLSYMGWFKCTDTWHCYKNHVEPYIDKEKLKAVVRERSRRCTQEKVKAQYSPI